MTAHMERISLLFFGLLFLMKYPALVEAKDVNTENLLSSEEEFNNNSDRGLKTRGFLDGLVSNIHGTISGSGNVINNFNNDSDDDQDFSDADITAGALGTSFNNSGKGKQIISGTIINSGPRSGDGNGFGNVNSFSGMTIFGNNNTPAMASSSGNTCDMSFNGIILRGLNIRNARAKIIRNQLYIGKKVICADIKKVSLGELTYQKLDDGSLWYTNIKIGKPMTKAEMDKFEADWAQHKKLQEEQAAEKEKQFNQRMDSMNQRFKQKMDRNNNRQKERMDTMNERLKRQADMRARRMKRHAENKERRAKRASMEKTYSFWE